MIIVSNSGHHLDWLKSAQTEGEASVSFGVDSLSDDDLRGFAPVTVDVEKAEIAPAPEGEVVTEVSEEAPVDIPGTPEDESLPSEAGKGDLAGRVADLVDDVAAVQDKLQDIAEDAQEVGEMAKGGAIDEVEIELEDEIEGEKADESVEEVTEEVSEEAPLSSETTGEPEEVEEEELVVAGDNRVFMKFANLSADTKKQVQDYFSNVLGYDPEYVKLMVKDYKV